MGATEEAGFTCAAVLQRVSPDRHGAISTYCKALANNRQAGAQPQREGGREENIHYKTLIHFEVAQISVHCPEEAPIPTEHSHHYVLFSIDTMETHHDYNNIFIDCYPFK